MKHLSILLLILFMAISTAFTAHAANPAIGFASKLSVSNTRLAAIQAGNSILVKKFDYNTSSAFADYDCGKYKRIRNAGIILLSVGGATFVGGIAAITVGVGNAYYEGDGFATVGLIGGGAVLTVLGVGMMGAGTALTIVGAVKLRKYCNGSTSSTRRFYINPTTAHGIGFAARF